jgi:hypothetical protein
MKHRGKHLSAELQALAVDSRGRYLLSGFTGIEHFGFASALTLVRVTHGGKPDPSFGAHGRVQMKVLHGGKHEHDDGFDVIADGRDRALVVGHASTVSHRNKLNKARAAFALRFKG